MFRGHQMVVFGAVRRVSSLLLMSSPVRKKIAGYARTRRDAYVQATLDVVAMGPPQPGAPPLGRRDVEQMIDGFLAMLTEALDGEAREVRTFFLETLIPSLVGSGTPLDGIVGGVVELAIIVSIDVAEWLPPEERAEARSWLARFFNEYVAELIRVAQGASK